MFLLMIMLFMIGQALNMSAVFWTFWWITLIALIVQSANIELTANLEKKITDKIDSTIDDITNKVSREEWF